MESEQSSARALILDDEFEIRELLKEVASEAGYAVFDTDVAEVFLAQVTEFDPTIVFIDLMMPNVDGVEILRQLGERNATCDVVIMSGAHSKILSTAMDLGKRYGLQVRKCLSKPIDLNALAMDLKEWAGAQENVSVQQIRSAMARGEFELFLQPKIQIKRAMGFPIKSAEALIRWHHPTRGILLPGEFLGFVEENGLMAELTDYVLNQATGIAKALDEVKADVRLAVNVPPESFEEAGFVDALTTRVLDAGLKPQAFTLEVTERSQVSENAEALENLTRLRLKGFGLSMDDFGTGYSSLFDLHRLPFNELKIDRAFISPIEESKESQTIVRALAGLAQNLGLIVCAEGVESYGTLEFLEHIGCNIAQGFFVSRALPFEDLLAFKRHWENRWASTEAEKRQSKEAG